MQKDEIADILKEIGVFLELKGENPFTPRAYQNGARPLERLTAPLALFRLLSTPGEALRGQAMALAVVLMGLTACAVLAIERVRGPIRGSL